MPEDKPEGGQAEGESSVRLSQDIQALSAFAERLRIREYVELLQKPRRLLWLHFLAGIARGAGIAVGTIAILAFITYVLSTIVNAPMIGKSLAPIVHEIQSHLPSRK